MSKRKLDKVFFYLKKNANTEGRNSVLVSRSADTISEDLNMSFYEVNEFIKQLEEDKYILHNDYGQGKYYHVNPVYSDFKGYNKAWWQTRAVKIIAFIATVVVILSTLIGGYFQLFPKQQIEQHTTDRK